MSETAADKVLQNQEGAGASIETLPEPKTTGGKQMLAELLAVRGGTDGQTSAAPTDAPAQLEKSESQTQDQSVAEARKTLKRAGFTDDDLVDMTPNRVLAWAEKFGPRVADEQRTYQDNRRLTGMLKTQLKGTLSEVLNEMGIKPQQQPSPTLEKIERIRQNYGDDLADLVKEIVGSAGEARSVQTEVKVQKTEAPVDDFAAAQEKILLQGARRQMSQEFPEIKDNLAYGRVVRRMRLLNGDPEFYDPDSGTPDLYAMMQKVCEIEFRDNYQERQSTDRQLRLQREGQPADYGAGRSSRSDNGSRGAGGVVTIAQMRAAAGMPARDQKRA